MIFAPQKCLFDPGTLACPAEKSEGCLSAAHVNAVRTVMQGPRTAAGRQVYPGYYYDTGIATTQGLPGVLVGPFIPESRPVGTSFDVDAAAADAMDARSMVGDSSAWTNLSTFRGHGGKLIFAHGVSDPWFSAQESVRYYEALGRDNAETPLAEWSRLFLVPGMGHCGGGARTFDQFDLLSPLIDWVESGRAPESVIATSKTVPGESRPLCPFPRHAHFDGSGDARQSPNYTCRE
jgi:feruloyl esterase